MSLHVDTFLELKVYHNVFAAGAPPRTPLGELTALFRPHHLHFGEGKEGEWEREKRERTADGNGKGTGKV